MKIIINNKEVLSGIVTLEGVFKGYNFIYQEDTLNGAYTLKNNDDIQYLSVIDQEFILNSCNSGQYKLQIEDDYNIKSNTNFPNTIVDVVIKNEDCELIHLFLKQNLIYNLKINDSGLNYMNNGTLIENNCITNISVEDANKIKKYFNDIQIVNSRSILTKEILEGLNNSDKITVKSNNIIKKEIKGTIYNITDNKILIKKYRCKTAFLELYIGQTVSITNGWN